MRRRNPRRERLKHILPPEPLLRVTVSPWPPVQPLDFPPTLLMQPREFSHMIDTVGYPMNYNNPVHHKKYKFAGKGVPSFERYITGQPGSGWRSFYFTPALKPPDCTQLLLDEDLIPPPEWFADFAEKANKHFAEAVDTKTLLANFLLELIALIVDIIKALKNLAKRFVEALTRFFSKLKEVGDLWLAWNFAIKPFVRDAKTIAKSLRTAEKRLKWLRENNHKDTRVAYRHRPYQSEKAGDGKSMPCYELNLCQFYNDWGGFLLYPGAAADECSWQVHDLTLELRACANAVVRFDIPDELLNSPRASAVVWAKLMGLNNPAAIVWEATPFSWLIDWFVGHKTALLIQLGEIRLFPDAKILAAGHSYHYKIRGEVRWKGPDDRNFVPQVLELGFANLSYYNRVPGPPSAWSPLLTVPLHWYNASILAAIIRQKRRRR